MSKDDEISMNFTSYAVASERPSSEETHLDRSKSDLLPTKMTTFLLPFVEPPFVTVGGDPPVMEFFLG